MRKKIGNVLRGLKYRFKHYLPRLEAEGIIIKWRVLIADAYTKHMASVSPEDLKSKKYKVVTHMDLVTELMYADGYSGDHGFQVVDLSPAGPVCSYHGLKIVCDPYQVATGLVRVVEDK